MGKSRKGRGSKGATRGRSAPLAWAVFGYCAVVALFADSFDLPGWATAFSPFEHTPQVPLDDLTPAPLAIATVLGAAFVVAGFIGVRRRDVGY